MQWYTIQTQANYENTVKKSLEAAVSLKPELQEKFGQIVVPTEKVVELKGGTKVVSERRLYPSYVFVEMELTDETWHLVRHVPKVSGFVGGSRTAPTPLSKREIDGILKHMATTQEAPVQKISYGEGEAVLIIDGAFKDFQGTVRSVDYDKGKLVVEVSIFGRGTPTEFSFAQIKKIQD